MEIHRFYLYLRTQTYIYVINRKISLFLFILFFFPSLAQAAYTPFNTNVAGNIGIGSANPGQRLDVNGTVRATTFIGNGSQLTGINTSQWTLTNTNDAYLPNSGNVGIGTTITSAGAALSVMNGNVGIGTWSPTAALEVKGNITTNSSIGVGNETTTNGLVDVENSQNSYTRMYLRNSNSGGSAQTQYVAQNDNSSSSVIFGIDSSGSSNVALANRAYIYAGTGTTGFSAVADSGGDIRLYTGGYGASNEKARLTNAGNLGIGTTTPAGALTVMNGNVGIGTWVPGGALIVKGGNVGLGSNNPGQVLDVTGTVRATAFIGNGSQLTGIGGMQWTTTNTNDVYLPNNGNVGLGTTITGGAALSVMNGNVGIGTWAPGAQVQINMAQTSIKGLKIIAPDNSSFKQLLDLYSQGGSGAAEWYIGEGTESIPYLYIGGGSATSYFWRGNWNDTSNPANTLKSASDTAGQVVASILGNSSQSADILQVFKSSTLLFNVNSTGNVGIGSTVPGQSLDVQGTIRMTGFNIAANAGTNKVLTSDASGNGTWQTAAGGSSQWITTAGVGIGTYSNVGIGTTSPQGGLVVTNGNVGIGTWVPGGSLIVKGGNVGIGSNVPGQALDVIGTVRATAFIGNGAGLTGLAPSQWTTTNTNDVYLPNNGNVGLGTTITAGGALSVMNGNVGIGTWVPGGSLIVKGGNVGIGSNVPGQALDVIGTVRATAFIGNGAGLTGLAPSQWTTTNTNDVYLPNNGNVGLGTTITAGGALSVMNGNVGIGTWVPSYSLAVSGTGAFGSGGMPVSQSLLNIYTSNTYSPSLAAESAAGWEFRGGNTSLVGASDNAAPWGVWLQVRDSLSSGFSYPLILNPLGGNIGIGTRTPAGGLAIMNGNVGIGTWVPGQLLDVKGTAQMAGFSLTGNGASAGNVLVTNGVGVGTWMAASTLPISGGASQWTTTNTHDVYLPSNGNVGIGTNLTATSALTVMNGNVGIGTWKPVDIFQIGNYISSSSGFMVDSNGNVGIGTITTSSASLTVLNGNVGIGITNPGAILDVNGGGMIVENSVAPDYALKSSGTEYGAYALATSSLQYSDSANAHDIIVRSEVGDLLLSGQSSSSNIKFTTGPSNSDSVKVEIINSGNVGIGSVVPGQLLDVQGTLRVLGGGSVGIGTSLVSTSALTVMNGNVGIGTWIPRSGLEMQQSFAVYRTSVSSSSNSAGQTIIGVNSSGGAYTVTLQTADKIPGRIMIIKDESGNAAANNITINTQSGNIDGAASIKITANYGVLRVYSDGTNWFTF